MISKQLLNIVNKYFYRPKWKNIEYFDECWKSRISAMAGLIEDEHIVLDIGCGKMWLKEYIDQSRIYFGCDYVQRDENTIVCDLNNHQFPELRADLCFVSGCFEYVEDFEWFIDKIMLCAPALIISYCTRELQPDLGVRKSMGWVNHLFLAEFITLIETRGFLLTKQPELITGDAIFKFIRQ